MLGVFFFQKKNPQADCSTGIPSYIFRNSPVYFSAGPNPLPFLLMSARFRCLGQCPFSSCFLLDLPDARVLLDCGGELPSWLRWYPQTGVHNPSGASSSVTDLPPLVSLGVDTLIDAPLALHLPDLSALGLVPPGRHCEPCSRAQRPSWTPAPVTAVDSPIAVQCTCELDVTSGDFSGISAVFLSHPHAMWGLPALTERFKLRANVPIYATEVKFV